MANPPFSLDDLRDCIVLQRYRVQYHARKRRRERGFSHSDIEQVILQGEVIESYPKAKPFPKCLMMKEFRNEPVYVVVAYSATDHFAFIITIHGYDSQKWIDPRTRRR